MHEGGVFTTRTVDRTSREWKDLTALNARLAPDLGMARGVTHAEYIRAQEDGRFYFLEIAARVGGAFIADLIETATGINLGPPIGVVPVGSTIRTSGQPWLATAGLTYRF